MQNAAIGTTTASFFPLVKSAVRKKLRVKVVIQFGPPIDLGAHTINTENDATLPAFTASRRNSQQTSYVAMIHAFATKLERQRNCVCSIVEPTFRLVSFSIHTPKQNVKPQPPSG